MKFSNNDSLVIHLITTVDVVIGSTRSSLTWPIVLLVDLGDGDAIWSPGFCLLPNRAGKVDQG